ncbi:SDR family NAD(P)-dependent oxidoreductase [Mycobacterium genavense]|uniref:SDR family NAD(P)-dependent oxidoreductase n=1 Tax=Mycobacterium genavense TaxID=36812 RepID=UPI0006875DBB|nr:SDR family NAD(P)-dependent oxidoreductase [Mycobacterium genavense]
MLVSGASRGIGRTLADRAAADGIRIALLAKTSTPNPKIAGTLNETAEAVRAAGGAALAIPCDVRDPGSVGDAVNAVAKAFSQLDIVVNNAGALDLRPTVALPPKSFDRLLAVNVEGPFTLVHTALPLFSASPHAHIVNISPPVNLEAAWVGAHVGHTVSKYAESLLTLGWSAEFAAFGETQATAQSRSPHIMADAMHALVTRPPITSGKFFTDEQLLREEGVTDFSEYRLAAREGDLTPNFYLPDTAVPTIGALQ